ncbi:MAG: hypothetical protein MHM6MM_000091 [Cercozoa sp. M6MM]
MSHNQISYFAQLPRRSTRIANVHAESLLALKAEVCRTEAAIEAGEYERPSLDALRLHERGRRRRGADRYASSPSTQGPTSLGAKDEEPGYSSLAERLRAKASVYQSMSSGSGSASDALVDFDRKRQEGLVTESPEEADTPAGWFREWMRLYTDPDSNLGAVDDEEVAEDVWAQDEDVHRPKKRRRTQENEPELAPLNTDVLGARHIWKVNAEQVRDVHRAEKEEARRLRRKQRAEQRAKRKRLLELRQQEEMRQEVLDRLLGLAKDD